MKYLILAAFLLLSTQFVLAQSVKFGIKGGYNRAFIDGGPLPAGTVGVFRPGFHAGVFATYGFNKWSVQPALLYSVKGYRVTSDGVINYSSATLPPPGSNIPLHIEGSQTYQYLELPINLLYNIKVKNDKIFLGGGPYMGYLLSAVGKRNTTIDNGTPTYTETNYDIGGNGTFKRIDLGVSIIVGFAFKNGLLFNAAFSNGLTNIIANQGSNPTPMTKNRVLSFSTGYSF